MVAYQVRCSTVSPWCTFQSCVYWIKADPITYRVISIDTPNPRNCYWAFPVLMLLLALNLQQNSTLFYAWEHYKMCCFIATIVWLALTKQSLHSWSQSGPAQRSPVTLSFSSTNRKCSISYVTVVTIHHSKSNKSPLVLSHYAQDVS